MVTAGSTEPLTLKHSFEYYVRDGFVEAITERIDAKEKKFQRYTGKGIVSRCWLLIVIDGVSDFSGFDLAQGTLLKGRPSPFERIYLFETFNANMILL